MELGAFNISNIVIDFIKLVVRDMDEIARVWRNPKLIFHDFNERLNHFDFETLITKETKKWRGILFCKLQNRLEILFRPHYFYNANTHNANDFSLTESVDCIKTFVEAFQISEPTKWKVINIEFGVNILVPGYGKELIGWTEYWKKTQFKYDADLAYSKKAYGVKPNGRPNTFKIVKLYAKGVQHPNYCHPDTIRFEIKSKQTKYILKHGISTLEDLLLEKVYTSMALDLGSTAKEVLILDNSTEFKNLDNNEKQRLTQYLNSYTWYCQTQKSVNMFSRMKTRYFSLLNKTGNNVHSIFHSQVTTKSAQLLGVESSPLSLASKNVRGDDSTIHISRIFTPIDLSQLKCAVTGITLEREGPIKSGKPIPKYIRTKTLKHLRQNDYELFIHLTSMLAPNISSNDFRLPKHDSSIISYCAHQIRNRFYNSKRKAIKKKGTVK
ncbi:hypothetical protein [Flagellimonas sp.]|uniref:hypothetical protein n=1 Tax=Flagellimonas sp. TaxID=2058762 RepID=UPI003BAF01B7